MSTSTDQFAAMNAPVERRFYPRVTPSAPIYVAFGSNNLGTLLNVSENGFSVGTPDPLDLNSVYRVYLSLDGASSAITVSVRTVWTAQAQNSSGIQLLDLSEQDREQIRNWVALQTARNESLDGWFSPKKAEPSTASTQRASTPIPSAREDQSAHENAELPPPETPKPHAKSEFPPMPLPIHGEFTYEPPPGQKTQILPVRRRHSAPRPKSPRSRSRSSMTGVLLWTASMAAICLGAGWSFRHQLADKLHRSAALFAKESTPSADQNSSPAVPDQPVVAAPSTEAPSTEAPSNPAASAGADDNAVAAPTPPPTPSTSTATPAAGAPAVSTSSHREPTLPASRLDMDSPRKHFAEPVAPQPPRSYVADSQAASPTAPVLIAKNDTIPAPAPVSQPIPAPVATVQTPAAAAAPTTVNTAPAPARNQPANASAADPSVAKVPVSNTPPRKSAIAGSIYQSDSSSLSATSRASTTDNSFVARGSNVTNSSATQPNSSAIQMDAPAAPVVEVTPPRGLAASFVDLPGERVLRSGSMTMHIQRSVRIPRERVPGERFIWRGHMKVSVGELTSRVDPQVAQLPVPYGSITVQATIDKGGYVINLQPLYGSYTLLPNVARAIREWRYEPTYVDNKPAETQAKIEIDIHPPSARAFKP